MFTAAFAQQVLAPAGQDQPGWVAGPVDFFAHLIAAHPASLNTGFVLIQLALGIGCFSHDWSDPRSVGSWHGQLRCGGSVRVWAALPPGMPP
jgi:hypothetical protein